MADNDWLDRVMELDHVIEVRPDGTVNEHPEPHVHAPESAVETDDDGQVLAAHEAAWTESVRSQGWEPETGWSGQDRYRGPFMHASEYIGGALAARILATPGLWVAVVVECLPSSDSDEEESDPAGWAVLHREAAEPSP